MTQANSPDFRDTPSFGTPDKQVSGDAMANFASDYWSGRITDDREALCAGDSPDVSVKVSVKSLDKLGTSLEAQVAAKGLEDLGVKGFDLDITSDNIRVTLRDQDNEKFSADGVAFDLKRNTDGSIELSNSNSKLFTKMVISSENGKDMMTIWDADGKRSVQELKSGTFNAALFVYDLAKQHQKRI